MSIKTETRDASAERTILTAMIVDGKVLEAIADRWPRDGLFRTRYANLVAGWCVRHWRKYSRAPGKAIETIAESWAEKGGDKDTVALIDRLLGSLSDEYEQRPDAPDPHHIIDLAADYFNRVRLTRLAEAIQEDADAGRDADAYAALAAYERISLNGDGVVCAADIPMERVLWLWRGWLATGELAILDGNPGEGKSQLTIDVAARVTRGNTMPLTDAKPRSAKSVLILTSEDSWAKTMAPRLTAAGADMQRVFTMTDPAITFPADIARLGHAIAAQDARLCIIDPITAYVSKDTDTNNDASVRRCLARLRMMAEDRKCAVLMIRHFRKSNAGAIHRGGGSVAFSAQCRLQHVVGPDPDGTGYVLACGKSNLAVPPRSLRYEIVEQRVPVPGKRAVKIETSRIEWLGECDTYADALAAPRKQGRPAVKDEAADLIRDLLEDAGDDGMPSADLQKRVMAELGIAERTFKDARRAVGAATRKDGFQGAWVSYLPD